MDEDCASKLAAKLKSCDYSDALCKIHDGLGISEKIEFVGIEALLIYTINKIYASKPDHIDITLMALCLLGDFYTQEDNPEEPRKLTTYSECRERFLIETDYINKTYGEKIKTYEDAKQTIKHTTKSKKTELDTIRNSLDKKTTNCIKKILSFLYSKRDSIDDYFEEAKNFIEQGARGNGFNGEIKWRRWHCLPTRSLPILQYYSRVRDSISPSSSSPDQKKPNDNVTTDETNDEKPSPPQSKPHSFCKLMMRIVSGMKNNHIKKFPRLNTIFLFIIIILLVIIAAALVKPAPSSRDQPKIDDYPSNKSNVPVEKIAVEHSPLTIYPGVATTLPIVIRPDEAVGTYLYCNSSDSNILYATDGYEPKVEAWDNHDPDTTTATVTVTVTPQNRATSDVYVEVPIIVDYTGTLPMPLN